MGARAVQKKEQTDDLVEELKSELRQAINELSLIGVQQGGRRLSAGLDFRTAVSEYERNLIVAALRAAQGQKKRGARLLKMSPSTLHGKIVALKINQEQFSS